MFMYRDAVQGEQYTSQSAIDEAHRYFASHDNPVVDLALENTLKVCCFISVIFEYRDKCKGWQNDGETCSGNVVYDVKDANSVGGTINRCRLST